MKKIGLFLAGCIITAASFAQWGNVRYGNDPYYNNGYAYSGYASSQLSISTTGRTFLVSVDGRQFNVNQTMLLNMTPGNHNIQVYRQDYGGGILGGLFGRR